jgi:LCP family protein required for cell wall assembly
MKPAVNKADPYPNRLRRALAWPNLVAVAVGLGAFAVGLRLWPTTTGTILAAALGGVVAALFWFAWYLAGGTRPVGKLLDLPGLGSIPDTPGSPTPTLTAPTSSAAAAYQRAASRMEALTRGRILLVAGVVDGQGATTAALNLAVAATRAGRRTLLIDGDITDARLSNFGHTGVSPGLVELAKGEATLGEASRLWSVDSTSRLPFIPAGRADPDAPVLPRSEVAAAVEDVATSADVVLIDTPVEGGPAIDALGALADGTLLVLPRAMDKGTVSQSVDRLRSLGAPPIGYLVNEAAPTPPSAHQHPVWRSLKRGLATALLVMVGYALFNGVQIWNSWRNVDRLSIDIAAASEVLPLPDDGIDVSELPEAAANSLTALPAEEGDFLSLLIVGSDLSGKLADVIILAIIPANGGDPVMVSIPRDLYINNPCTNSLAKINGALEGCPDKGIEGPALVALAIRQFTGIEVDHFALFDFEGFEEIVDQVGGVEICVDYPVRDSRAELQLPAGCTNATGAQALSWVRSRRTQELVDGRWQTMEGVNDLTRNQRQQDVILQVFAELSRLDSFEDLTRTVAGLTGAFSIDEALGMGDALSLMWSMRGMDVDQLQRLEIPVADELTSAGEMVLVPVLPFDQVLSEAFPDLAPTRTS